MGGVLEEKEVDRPGFGGKGGKVKVKVEVPVRLHQVIVLDAANGQELRRIKVGPSDHCLFFPDRKSVLSQDGNSLHVWDLATGIKIRTVTAEGGVGNLGLVAISADGNRVLGYAWVNAEVGKQRVQANSIKEWDLTTGKLTKLQDGGKQLQLTWHGYIPDDNSILCRVVGETGFWDMRQGKSTEFTASLAKCIDLAPTSSQVLTMISPSGKRVAALDLQGVVTIRDRPTSKIVATLPKIELSPMLWGPQFSPDEKKLLLCGTRLTLPDRSGLLERRLLVVWEFAESGMVRVLAYPGHPGHGPRPAPLAKKPKGWRLAVVHRNWGIGDSLRFSFDFKDLRQKCTPGALLSQGKRL
jgi:WD40 repeat protein